MLEVECTNLTPEEVLKTSGHVEKFADLMVKDEKTGECYRADKLLEDHIENLLADVTLPSARRDELRKIAAKADAYSPEELGAILAELNITGACRPVMPLVPPQTQLCAHQLRVSILPCVHPRTHTHPHTPTHTPAPATGNALSAPFPFNLMFQTSIGPTGKDAGYLRPETAQGIFVNFRRLLEQNGERMPFAAAQIGTGFRNEIAPRGGLLRCVCMCVCLWCGVWCVVVCVVPSLALVVPPLDRCLPLPPSVGVQTSALVPFLLFLLLCAVCLRHASHQWLCVVFVTMPCFVVFLAD